MNIMLLPHVQSIVPAPVNSLVLLMLLALGTFLLKQPASTFVDFDPRFEIMPGTKSRTIEVVTADPYEAVLRPNIAE